MAKKQDQTLADLKKLNMNDYDEQVKETPKEEVSEIVEEVPTNEIEIEAAEKPIKTKKGKAKKHGIKYSNGKKLIKNSTTFSISEALELAKKTKFANFNESVELHINLGVDPKNNDQRIRFTTTLPHGTGNAVKILAISEDNSGQKGNVLFRNETAVADILSGKLSPDKDFGVVISTMDKMKELAKVARTLGPKGMMPSPKFGTVTDDIAKAVENLSKGQIEIRTQAGHAVIHQVVGKIDFSSDKLEDNIKHVITEINKNTPAKIKTKLIQKAVIATSMGHGIKVEF